MSAQDASWSLHFYCPHADRPLPPLSFTPFHNSATLSVSDRPLLLLLKERGLKQGLFVAAADPDKDETLQQLLEFKFSPLEEVTASNGSAGTAVR